MQLGDITFSKTYDIPKEGGMDYAGYGRYGDYGNIRFGFDTSELTSPLQAVAVGGLWTALEATVAYFVWKSNAPKAIRWILLLNAIGAVGGTAYSVYKTAQKK